MATKTNDTRLGSYYTHGISLLAWSMLTCALVNSKAWPNDTMAAFYLTTITAGLFISVCAVLFISRPVYRPAFLTSLPGVFITGWALYVLWHGLAAEGMLPAHIYIITCCALIICFSALFQNNLQLALPISRFIALAAFIEVIVCFFQLAGIAPSASNSFTVTGTWVNPNVTAMFLTMCIPALGYLVKADSRKLNGYYMLLAGLMVIVLVLLNCRSAVIGLFVIAAIAAIQFTKEAWAVKSRLFKRTILLMLLTAMVGGGWLLFRYKPASSEGRLFVWKISAQMIGEKPLAGFGYGMFDRSYNLEQAGYFASGAATPNEKNNASYIRMGYNEYLQNMVEGGLPGLLIFLGILVFFLLKPPLRSSWKKAPQEAVLNTSAYAGIAAFAVMSFFNFTIQAMPVMFLFIIYTGIRTRFIGEPKNAVPVKSPRPLLRLLPALVLAVTGLFITIRQFRESNAQLTSKRAARLIKEQDFNKAASLLYPLEPVLGKSQGYWMTCAEMQIRNKEYQKAAYSIDMAKKVTANPDLYLMSGLCNYRQGKYPESEKDLELASFINPSLLEPHYRLMNIYARTNNTEKANLKAQFIIGATPKITSQKTDFYKQKAKELLAGKKDTGPDVPEIN